MPMPLARRQLLWLGLLPLAACASPETAYYRLTALPGAPRGAPARQVELRQVRLARYLDRPEIVRGEGGGRLALRSEERWAEPLDEMVTRLLAEALTQRLTGSVVREERSALGGRLDLLASLDLGRFEIDGQGRAVLEGRFALRRPGEDRVLLDRAVTETAPVSGTGTAAQVQALSGVLAALADRMAEALAALPAR